MTAKINSPDCLIIGNETSNTYGLYVDTPPKRSMAAQNTQKIDIPGREESLYVTDDEYEDVVMNIKALTFSNDFDISPVYTWLRSARSFSFSSEPNNCYRVKKLNGITPSYSGHGKNIYTISFVVSPFVYRTDEAVISKTAREFIVTNNGNHYCRPTIKVYGTGDISLIIADESTEGMPTTPDITIFGVDGYCVIDAERTLVHKDGEFVRFSGKIPFAAVGDNGFIWSGGYTKCELVMNERDV